MTFKMGYNKALKPLAGGTRKGQPVKVRLMNRIKKNRNECWIWLGGTINGYGRIYDAGKLHLVHRVSYEIHTGPIPKGLTLDHLCRVRRCINPDHLEPVTVKLNLLRGNGACARNARKRHCKRGHEFNKENTIPVGKSGRSCRPCKNMLQRKRRRKKN